MNLIQSLAQRVSLSQTAVILFAASIATGFAQTTNAPTPSIHIQADKVTAKMPPTFYGLMTEEINYSYEGGLYGELICNRTFKSDAIQQKLKPDAYDPTKYYPASYPTNMAPKFWDSIGGAALVLDASTPLND